MARMNPIQRERSRRESARVLKLVANPKRIASARGVSERQAQLMCAGDRGNPIGDAGGFLEALAREGGEVYRALEYLESKAEEGEMGIRGIAPEADYQEALQDLHDQMAAVLPRLMAEIRGEPDPAAMHESALDVAGAARKLAVRARQLQAAQRKERRAA